MTQTDDSELFQTPIKTTTTHTTTITTTIKKRKRTTKHNAQSASTKRIYSLQPMVPLSASDAQPTVLILGSMASTSAIAHQQFYAYKQNHFYPIMSHILQQDLLSMPYADRYNVLRGAGICMCDVIESCQRATNADSDIKNIVIRDFNQLLAQFNTIRRILCNGQLAYNLFQKHVNNGISDASKLIQQHNIHVLYVPSTSPAHAMKNAVVVKADKWRHAMYGVIDADDQ